MNETELIRLRELLKRARLHLVKAMREDAGEASAEADEGDRLVYCALVRVERAIADSRPVLQEQNIQGVAIELGLPTETIHND